MSGLTSRSAGFTLLELLVGITIGAGVLLALRQAAVSFANTTTSTVDNARRDERTMIARRLLERLVADMQPDSNARGALEGSAQRAEFDSWCATTEGWEERCRVALEVVVDSSRRPRLEMRSREARSTVTTSERDSLTLIYLADGSNGGLWHVSWTRALALPLAIGVVNGGDTLIVPVGAR